MPTLLLAFLVAVSFSVLRPSILFRKSSQGSAAICQVATFPETRRHLPPPPLVPHVPAALGIYHADVDNIRIQTKSEENTQKKCLEESVHHYCHIIVARRFNSAGRTVQRSDMTRHSDVSKGIGAVKVVPCGVH